MGLVPQSKGSPYTEEPLALKIEPPAGENSPTGGVILAMKFAQCFMLTLLRALVSSGTPMTVSTISGSMKVPL